MKAKPRNQKLNFVRSSIRFRHSPGSALPDGSPDFLNEQCRAYTGLCSQELRGSGWEAAVHADDMERMRDWWATLLQRRGTPGETEIRFRRFDGVYRWFLVRALPVFDEQQCVVAWYGNNTDIEDLKRAEEKLKQRETELQQIVDTIAELIIFLRPDGSALQANRFTLEYTGLSPEDFEGKGLRERIFHPDDVERLREERRKALLGSVPFGNEQRVLGKDGQYRWFSIRYNALLDQDGAPIRWYAAGIDIIERKKVEQRLRNENIALRLSGTRRRRGVCGNLSGSAWVCSQVEWAVHAVHCAKPNFKLHQCSTAAVSS